MGWLAQQLKIMYSIVNKHNNDNCADQESDLKSVGYERNIYLHKICDRLNNIRLDT